MTDRDPAAQLSTANWLIAEFRRQIADHDATGAHADRIDTLREGLATWEARADALRALSDVSADGEDASTWPDPEHDADAPS